MDFVTGCSPVNPTFSSSSSGDNLHLQDWFNEIHSSLLQPLNCRATTMRYVSVSLGQSLRLFGVSVFVVCTLVLALSEKIHHAPLILWYFFCFKIRQKVQCSVCGWKVYASVRKQFGKLTSVLEWIAFE